MIENFGLDWVTLTNIIDDEAGSSLLMFVFQEMSTSMAKWGAGGYQGKQDFDSGQKYGSRKRLDGRADEMLVTPGANAEEVVNKRVNPLEYRVTRMDLQVTKRLSVPCVNLASDLYHKLMKSRSAGDDIAKRRKIVLIQSETGSTLYLGSRKTGRKFFRLYDKSKDVDAGPGEVWRQEVQYGRDLAQGAMETYLNIRDDPAAIISLVCAEFQDALSYSLVDREPYGQEIVTGIARSEPTLEAKLEWLRTCVKPTIALMIDNDLEAEMLKALGLHSLAC